MEKIKIVLATVLVVMITYACTNSTVETNTSDSTKISCDTSFCVDTVHCKKVCTEVDSVK